MSADIYLAPGVADGHLCEVNVAPPQLSLTYDLQIFKEIHPSLCSFWNLIFRPKKIDETFSWWTLISWPNFSSVGPTTRVQWHTHTIDRLSTNLVDMHFFIVKNAYLH